MFSRLAVLLLLVVSCKNDPATFNPIEADTDTDADSDADADADSDADTDPAGLDCAPGAYPTPAPGIGEDACLTEEISCGDTVHGTNVGGSTHYGTNSGEQFEQCSGANFGDDFDGPERVYRLVPPPNINSVSITFDSCELSEMMYHRSSDSCITGLASQCGYLTEGTELSQEDTILLGASGVMNFVIEGRDNDGGNFRFTVECNE